MDIVGHLENLQSRTENLQKQAADSAIKLSEDYTDEMNEIEKINQLKREQLIRKEELDEKTRQNKIALKEARYDVLSNILRCCKLILIIGAEVSSGREILKKIFHLLPI